MRVVFVQKKKPMVRTKWVQRLVSYKPLLVANVETLTKRPKRGVIRFEIIIAYAVKKKKRKLTAT